MRSALRLSASHVVMLSARNLLARAQCTCRISSTRSYGTAVASTPSEPAKTKETRKSDWKRRQVSSLLGSSFKANLTTV